LVEDEDILGDEVGVCLGIFGVVVQELLDEV
jgi:hypothetical protein